jgi:hypothetical protein
MTTMNVLDESGLGQALRDASSAQPPQPVDRAFTIMARAPRARARRVGTGLGVTIAVLGLTTTGVMALAGPLAEGHRAGTGVGAPPAITPTPAPPPRVASSPVADWPDRSLATDQGVAAGAIHGWILDSGGTAQVRWLFRGTVQTSTLGPTYVAVALSPASGPHQQVLVGYVQRDAVNSTGRVISQNPGTGWSTWIYGPASEVSTITFPLVPPKNTFPWLDQPPVPTGVDMFALGDPAARQFHWRVTPLPYAQAAMPPGVIAASSGTLTSANGVFLGHRPLRTGPA